MSEVGWKTVRRLKGEAIKAVALKRGKDFLTHDQRSRTLATARQQLQSQSNHPTVAYDQRSA